MGGEREGQGPSVMTQDAGGWGRRSEAPTFHRWAGRILRGLVSQERLVLASLIQDPLIWGR